MRIFCFFGRHKYRWLNHHWGNHRFLQIGVCRRCQKVTTRPIVSGWKS